MQCFNSISESSSEIHEEKFFMIYVSCCVVLLVLLLLICQQFHTVPGQNVTDIPLIDKSAVTCKPHSSRITSFCACNCGRTQAQREDPFDLKVLVLRFIKTLVISVVVED